jgi:hypothetical protein
VTKQQTTAIRKALIITSVSAALTTGAAATEDFCAVVLKTPDGFLALREGPGTKFKVKARLRRGDVLYADSRGCIYGVCDEMGRWVYVNHVPRLDGNLEKARHLTQGWVVRRFVQEFGGPDMPCSAAYSPPSTRRPQEPAQAVDKKAKTPEQACQAQALASIAREWSNVFRGNFEIILKGNRCLVSLQAPSIFEGKRTAWLIDGKTGELLSEFYGPKDSDRGLCSYRGGKFPTAECTWKEYLDKANQM